MPSQLTENGAWVAWLVGPSVPSTDTAQSAGVPLRCTPLVAVAATTRSLGLASVVRRAPIARSARDCSGTLSIIPETKWNASAADLK